MGKDDGKDDGEGDGEGAAALRIGFIGLGTMGAPIAQRIMQSGYPITVWARRAQAMEPLIAQGAKAAQSVAEVAKYSDYVGLCVLDDAAVAAICNDLLPAMRSGSVLAIHSTILPESCEALEARCNERGILFVDAPVDGSGADAAAGALTVMASGKPDALALAQPVLECFGKNVFQLGAAGAGQRAKVICNSLLTAHLGLAHAAMNMGDAFGLERETLLNVIQHSAANSAGFAIYPHLSGPQSAPLLYKDLGLLEATDRANHNIAIISHAARFWLNSDKAD